MVGPKAFGGDGQPITPTYQSTAPSRPVNGGERRPRRHGPCGTGCGRTSCRSSSTIPLYLIVYIWSDPPQELNVQEYKYAHLVMTSSEGGRSIE